jgi:hypothetical protein
MPLIPFQILGVGLRGLFAVALLRFGGYLLKYGYDHRYHEVRIRPSRVLGVKEQAADDTYTPVQSTLRKATRSVFSGLVRLSS